MQDAIRRTACALALTLSLAGQTNSPAPAASFAIGGAVKSPLTLVTADLAGMPRETVSVEEQGGEKIAYEGVSLQALLQKAGVDFGTHLRGKALAGYVLAQARDGYEVVFSLGELDPGLGGAHVIVADRRDGKPLFGYQGPFRLVVATDKAPARSVRMLEKLEVVELRK
jgi:hypothetical protein